MRPVSFSLLIFIIASALFALPALATTIHVPADQPTIQTGINAASPGDIVLVNSGTYTETVDFLGKAITLLSEQGAYETVIDGNGAGSVVTFDNEEFENTVIDGFTITNGFGTSVGSDTYGGGIFCNSSSPIITNCILAGNSADYGSGLYCGHSSPIIKNCQIMQSDTYGIYCLSSSPTFTNCTVMDNNSSGIRLRFSSPVISNCTVMDNRGSGIYCYYSSPRILNCTIQGNSFTGIHCHSYSSPMISNCTITENQTGISLHTYCSPTVFNCAITENGHSLHGGGIYCYLSSPLLMNCTISRNSSQSGGGLWCSLASPTITNCIFWENSASEGPEIYEYGTSTFLITYSDIQGGWAGEGNIDSDPLFVGDDDFHLSPTSPCIDAGNPGLSYDDLCHPPSIGTDWNDMGAYGGPKACGWNCWDVDGDGHDDEACGGGDCDDLNQETFPGAFEVCDGKDNDCDGILNEEERDDDYDGWYICLGDCDDSNPEIHPTHRENPENGVDDDCDGIVDEPFSIFHVPADQPTIQAGIDVAGENDVVLVAPGTYFENIDFRGKEITLQSESGYSATVIDGNGNGTVLTFVHGETDNSVIKGFTIRNGNAVTAGGIYCYDSSPTIADCSISENSGSGIYCEFLSSPTIIDCSITENRTGLDSIDIEKGGGIYCNLSSDPLITNCLITGNVADQGGGICCYRSNAKIAGCTISSNIGGGLYCQESSSEIKNCTFIGNSASSGGGIYCWDSSLKVMNCIVAENNASAGGGIHCHSPSQMTIMNSTISENNASSAGGGIYSTASIIIRNCIVSGNSASDGGGIYLAGESYPIITNLTIANNCATGVGGGGCIYFTYPMISSSIFWGNSASMGHQIFFFSSFPVVIYSDVQGGFLGWENIDEDPLFVEEEDYHLREVSPCIDAGSPTQPNYDICSPPSMGTERNDMGAYGGPWACGWICWDNDGDGYYDEVCGGTDCDDADPLVSPGFPESYAAGDCDDGKDNDCDGLTDMDPECTPPCAVLAVPISHCPITLYLIPALALIFLGRRFLRK